MNLHKKFPFRIGAVLTVAASCMLAVAQSFQTINPADYSVPTWTRIQRMLSEMKDASRPYSINVTVNGDPKTRVGIAWFTNSTCTDGKVQIVECPASENPEPNPDPNPEPDPNPDPGPDPGSDPVCLSESDTDFTPDFSSPTMEVAATYEFTRPLNYSNANNKLGGVEPDEKIVYCSHKALVSDLKPGTKYYYRVGCDEFWSETGSFTTADDSTDYSFIYLTDTQAENDEEFDVSQITVHTAVRTVPDAAFIMFNGDFVESWGENNSEWEYEQWFSTMQDVWLNNTLVATHGNHDKTPNENYKWHFNFDNSFNETSPVKTLLDGAVYSFERGDVLYLIISTEDWGIPGYYAALADWMREQASRSTAKWRIASFHRNMFTGSWHQDDLEQLRTREALLPVFGELNIDIAIQGHDHLYEVIGPVRSSDMTLVEGAVQMLEDAGSPGRIENMTGKAGGVYDVTEGTLYFLNNSAGKKKYWPRNESQMTASYDKHKVENYFGLFTGMFGQPENGAPTFSRVDVSSDKITFTTYFINSDGEAQYLDSFDVVKQDADTGISEATADEEPRIMRQGDNISVGGRSDCEIAVYGTDGTKVAYTRSHTLDISSLSRGIYAVQVLSGRKSVTSKIEKR